MTIFLRRLAALALVAGLLLPGAPLFPGTLHAQLPAPATAEPHLTAHTMRHILERHGPDSTAPDASKYAHGTMPATIRGMIAEAIREGHPHPDTNGRAATLYDYSFKHDIGTTIEGRPTRTIRVVVAPDGAVLTAYPR